MLGIGGANVVEKVIAPAGEFGEEVHVLLNDGRGGVVVGVHRFPALEVHIRVLAGASHHRMVRVEAPVPVGVYQLVVDHFPEDVVAEGFDLLDLVAGPEAVEEVHEGDAALQRCRMGDCGKVRDLLNAGACQKAEAGVPHGHHVAVVTEDGEGLACKAPGGNMEHRRGELGGDLVHGGDHQKEALACGESGGKGTCLQGAVHRR